jgi:hypothetical protein
LYGEVGLAVRLAFVAELRLLGVVATTRPGERAREAIGVGDLDVGVRLQLLDEEVACAVEARLGIPTGNADAAQPLGTGDLRGEFVLSIGRVWERVPVFLVAELGARIRSSGTQRAQAAGRDASMVDPLEPTAAAARVTIDYASELVYRLELGYLWRVRGHERLRITPRLSLDGRHGLSAPTPLPIDPVAPASLRLLRLGAALGFSVALLSRERASFSTGEVHVGLGGGAFVWGEGLPAAGEVSLWLGLSR